MRQAGVGGLGVRAWEDPSAAVGETVYSVKVEAEPSEEGTA